MLKKSNQYLIETKFMKVDTMYGIFDNQGRKEIGCVSQKTAEAGCWDKIPSKDNKQGSLQAMQ